MWDNENDKQKVWDTSVGPFNHMYIYLYMCVSKAYKNMDCFWQQIAIH